MPAGRLRSIAKNRRKAYEALRKKGISKQIAAMIANAGKTKKGRSAMAKKAARTRKRNRSRRKR